MAAMTSVMSAAPITARPCLSRAGAKQPAPRTAFSARHQLVRRSQVAGLQRKVIVRAVPETEEPGQIDVENLVKDWQEKWDKVENKTSVAVYGIGALVTIWLSSTIVSSVNSVPLLPKFLELIGLGYSAWFVYRYLLFKSSREELIQDVEELKKKITGAAEEMGRPVSLQGSKQGSKASNGNGSGAKPIARPSFSSPTPPPQSNRGAPVSNAVRSRIPQPAANEDELISDN